LLARSLAVQVLIVTGVGVLVGAALFAPLAGRRVGGLVLRMELRTVVIWGVVFVALAVLGSLASLRRVLRVDPVTAASGEGDR
jgi:ABC-type antimicrobial peptide transport system permease subunit